MGHNPECAHHHLKEGNKDLLLLLKEASKVDLRVVSNRVAVAARLTKHSEDHPGTGPSVGLLSKTIRCHLQTLKIQQGTMVSSLLSKVASRGLRVGAMISARVA
jgi:hypothetical protein